MKYPTGEYREGFVLEENQADPASPQFRNEYRELLEKWVPVGNRAVRLVPQTGREFWQAKQSISATTLQANFRFLAGLTTTRHRIRRGNQVYGIEAAMDLDSRGYEHECIVVGKELKKGEQPVQ